VKKPLAVDLFCGLGGWTEGLMAEGWHCRGYDIEAHEYGDERYPGEFVLADVMALTGADVADADLIVASPPCQEFSYMAMPWGRAKQIARALRGQDEFPEGYRGSRTLADLTALFDACFRIQREANEIRAARGQPPIPMVVENVRGAIPWLGSAAWNYGSFYLWGDIPALMPSSIHAIKNGDAGWGSWFAIGAPGQTKVKGNPDGRKNPGFRFDGSGRSFQSESVNRHVSDGHKHRDQDGYDRTHSNAFGWKAPRTTSKGAARKAASAKIAKIPIALGSHIARVYRPETLPANQNTAQPKNHAL
jgi:hypothetical protein